MKRNKYLILILLTWSLFPFCWQVYTSFSVSESILNPISQIESRWTLDNYIQVLTANPPFWRYLLNSTIVGTLSTVLTILLAIPASYAIARLKSFSKNTIKILLLTASLFPYVLLFLSLLEIARKLDLGNNLVALSIPYAALSMPLAILLLSSAFQDLPLNLEEAAIIEGLDLWQRIRLILIPLISPTLASTGIIIFLFSWNEYPIALTWISKSELITLPVAIARIAGSSVYSVPYGAYAAATVLGALPLILIVLLFQRQIISGLTQGAIKG
ncbi:carbohydrate ABC transporter permease [Prochlorococcus sp. MIT 1307]|uniref:carbohydrate ABC transporter permease n=1 Tax=Prochlorococcus sp. MIT 1307 TaxID=3096219 RepID=UPI002A75268B|nr:carbohydrate ABC transporter permease [Prochlorococcus sp. MIT 1307]